MPVFLVHGFRWHRKSVCIHIANYNIDDASPEWVHMGTTSGEAVRDSLNHLYPELMEATDSSSSDIYLIEQNGEGPVDGYKQPWVYVCDWMARMDGCSLDVGEVAGKWGLEDGPSDRIMKLRDELQPQEKIGMWAVLCIDEKHNPGVKLSQETGVDDDCQRKLDRKVELPRKGSVIKATNDGLSYIDTTNPEPQSAPDPDHNESNTQSIRSPLRSLFRKKSRGKT